MRNRRSTRRSIWRIPWLSGMAADVLVLVRITSGMSAASAQHPASTPAVNGSTGPGSSDQELEGGSPHFGACRRGFSRGRVCCSAC
jgi:hypothetical protein